MTESSKKKRTAAKKPASRKKVAAAAKSLLKKKLPARTRAGSSSAVKRTVRTRSAKLSAPPLSGEAPLSQNVVEESKYFSGPIMQKFIGEPCFELPEGYNDNRITVMVRDPNWVHAYWELPSWKLDEMKSLMGFDVFSRSKRILRVYDVTDVHFTGLNANKSFDIHLSDDARNWYINTAEPSRSYCVDIGFLTPEGKFYVAARSNVVSTPRDSMSDVIDEEWMTIDWERMYALSGGFGIGRSSGEIREMLKKRLREELSSGQVSSWSRDIHAEREINKDFWLVVNTELIVYGATEPDAKLTVQGLPVKLRSDGSFTLRFALPDGRQEIPIVAFDREGDQKRYVTPTVEKRTK